MDSIVRATVNDVALISELGRLSFIESHGSSAAPHEIGSYIRATYNPETLTKELTEPKNIYFIITHDGTPAGFSKIVLNVPHKDMKERNITKLDRIYLLQQFYGLKLGHKLLEVNLAFSKANNQAGIWLLVWTKNTRAIGFYKKSGFKKIGDDYYKLTNTHSNPNFIMFLQYQ